MVVLRLHRQYIREATEDVATFTMEFRTLYDPLPQDDPGPQSEDDQTPLLQGDASLLPQEDTGSLPQVDPGYIELEYIELSPSHSSPVVDDNGKEYFLTVKVFRCLRAIDWLTLMTLTYTLDVHMHQPFLWSIDVKIKDTKAQKSPVDIISYSVSGDGNYVATLSTDGTIIQLDVWDLELEFQAKEDKDDYNEKRGPFAPKLCGQHQPRISDEALGMLCGWFNWARVGGSKQNLTFIIYE
jgi:hypothetical protein